MTRWERTGRAFGMLGWLAGAQAMIAVGSIQGLAGSWLGGFGLYWILAREWNGDETRKEAVRRHVLATAAVGAAAAAAAIAAAAGGSEDVGARVPWHQLPSVAVLLGAIRNARWGPRIDDETYQDPKRVSRTREQDERTEIERTAKSITRLLARLQDWRHAEDWLTGGRQPPESVRHGTENGRRWTEVDGERFTEDDLAWLRRRVVLENTESVAGRTSWQEWPDLCPRAEGPRPADRVDEIRIELRTGKGSTCYLYCAAGSDGPAGIVGSTVLRTFGNEQDATAPTDPTVEIPTADDDSDNLDWLASSAVRERLPEH